MVRRIGILSGGGDCPGINAVIRAVVYAAISEYGWDVIGIEDGYDGLVLPNRTRELTVSEVRGILARGGTILGTTNRSNPFAYVSEQNGRLIEEDRSAEALARAAELGIDALIAIGGDGSLSISHQFHQLGLPVIGIPKTIDNDLFATDYTFGFRTAVDVATDALDRLATTAESHHRVMVLEVMGRNAGWIALESGMAGGAHIVLLPEIPFDLDIVSQFVQYRAHDLGSNFSVIVVAEGCPTSDRVQLMESSTLPGVASRLSGIGNWLVHEVTRRTGIEARATTLGHIQRGGSPNASDRILATRFGAEAVALIDRGEFGKMVALQGQRIVAVPLESAIGAQRTVPPDSELVAQARRVGVCFGDRLPPRVSRRQRERAEFDQGLHPQ